MKRLSWIVAVVTLVCLLGRAEEAVAQYPPGTPYGPPQANTYLNVLRGGANPGANYFSLVRPQLSNQAGISGLQQQTQLNQVLITGLGAGSGAGTAGPVTTGQPFGFQTQLVYFQNQFRFGQMAGGGGGAVGGAGTGGAAGFGVAGAGGAGPAGAVGGPARGGAPRGR